MKTILGILLFSLVFAAGADAAETEWKAGLATVNITPEKAVPMAGYASRTRPFEKIEQDIYAKALALEDRQGHRAVLVTTDLLGLSRALADPVCERIQQKTKLARSDILLNSAHTHSAPMLIDQDRTASGVMPEDARNLVDYTRSLQDKLVEVATEALSRLEPAHLSWSSGVAHFAMNRREFTPRGVILGVNPRGLVDRTVPVLRVDSAEGKLRAVLFGYACHNTTLTQTNYNLCGDYAGFAQSFVQERQPGVQAMFMIGCGGDANPYPRGMMADARENGATLGQEVCRVLNGSLRPVRGSLMCVFDQASLPLQKFSRPELEKMTNGPSWQTGSARAMLAKVDRGEKLPATYECSVAVWQFGNDLTLVGLAGEVVVDYVPLIEQAIGPLQLWLTAYCNDVFGYLPSARVLQEGGYECRGLYTTQGFFAPAAQDVLVAKVRELAQRAGAEAAVGHKMKAQILVLAIRLFLLPIGFDLKAADQFEKETVVYKEVGALRIKADVYHYPDAKVRPVVVSLHGGALIMGHRESLTGPVKHFALTNGYVLVSFDYRLAPETKLPAIIEDIEDAFHWLRREGSKRFHIDPERIAVTGGSAGGYLTLATGHRVQPRPRVLLAYFGYGDLIGDWYSTPSPHPRHNQRKIAGEEAWRQVSGAAVADARERKGDGGVFYNFCRQTGQWPKAVSGWDPRDESEKFFPFMPVKNVSAAYPPTVLIHGTSDTDVPFEQSQLMAQEFRKHGVAFQFHEIAKAEHGLTGGDRGEIDEAQRNAFEFVKRHLERQD